MSELQSKIEKMKSGLNNPAVPENIKDVMRKKIAELEAQIASEKKAEPKKAEPKKAEPKPKDEKKEKPKAEPKPTTNVAKKSDEDCDTLIKKERERKAKAKANAEKRKNAPKKTPATKNKEAIAKVAERVEKNVEKRVEKGTVGRAELEKLISETEALLKALKSQLHALGKAKKMGEGGQLSEDTAPNFDNGGAYAKGGSVKRSKAGIKADKAYKALKSGERVSHKYANVEMKGGGHYSRRNANQFGKVKGGNSYTENRDNRSDKDQRSKI